MLVGENKYRIGTNVEVVGYYRLKGVKGQIVDLRIKTKRRTRYIQYKIKFEGLKQKYLRNPSWWFDEKYLIEWKFSNSRIERFLKSIFHRFM